MSTQFRDSHGRIFLASNKSGSTTMLKSCTLEFILLQKAEKKRIASIIVIFILGFLASNKNQSIIEALSQSDITNNQTQILNKSGSIAIAKDVLPSCVTSKMGQTELAPVLPVGSLSTADRVVNELSNATANEISKYPINDLDSDVLLTVFSELSPDSLYRVLHNLSHSDLESLLAEKFTPDQSNQILNRLPESKNIEIRNLSNFWTC